MKIVLTGASGLLGSAFAQAADHRAHKVIGIVNSYTDPIPGLAEQKPLNLSDFANLEAFILETFPDAIVNCAAISLPYQCQKDPELSEHINVALPEKLAILSKHLFARYIHISTDQVFDGKNPPYHVTDPASPTSLYGSQKAESEERVLKYAAEFASIVRIPLLSGNSPRGNRSLHEHLLGSLSENRLPSLFVDEFRQPCSTDNVAKALVELCERNDFRGLLHWAGKDRLSRFRIGEELLDHFGLRRSLINQAELTENPKFSQRPPDLTLDIKPLAGQLKTQPASFREHLNSLIIPRQYREWYNSL